jgi:hypothetical protein
MSSAPAFKGATLFSPLARTLLDRFAEGVILFDADGRLAYANALGQQVLDSLAGGNGLDTRSLLPKLGHAVYVPDHRSRDTLADQERRAIVDTLHATGWKLTETARRLGISRTTLWRRLRAWEIEAPGERDPGGDASA